MNRFLFVTLFASLLIPTVAKADTFSEWRKECILAAHKNGINERIMFSPIQLERTCNCSAKASENKDVFESPDWCPTYKVIGIDVMNKKYIQRWD